MRVLPVLVGLVACGGCSVESPIVFDAIECREPVGGAVLTLFSAPSNATCRNCVSCGICEPVRSVVCPASGLANEIDYQNVFRGADLGDVEQDASYCIRLVGLGPGVAEALGAGSSCVELGSPLAPTQATFCAFSAGAAPVTGDTVTVRNAICANAQPDAVAACIVADPALAPTREFCCDKSPEAPDFQCAPGQEAGETEWWDCRDPKVPVRKSTCPITRTCEGASPADCEDGPCTCAPMGCDPVSFGPTCIEREPGGSVRLFCDDTRDPPVLQQEVCADGCDPATSQCIDTIGCPGSPICSPDGTSVLQCVDGSRVECRCQTGTCVAGDPTACRPACPP